ncbi:MAG: DUF302 domain-containing protein [Phycisphaerales bacterium]|nr:MAG: DUF302 domain-containing protein [Phycisphaerales bacterium]
MLYVQEVHGSVDDIVGKIGQAAKDNNFGVLDIHDLKQKMASKGVDFAPECRIVEVCNPHKAKEVLDSNMAISAALPCRISVYEEDGKVKIATIRPTYMLDLFDSPTLKSVAQNVEETIVRIISLALKGG